MRKVFPNIGVAVVLVAFLASTAHAKDEFENGFKSELGAMAARSAVGLGLGVINEIVAGPGAYFDGYYGPPARSYYDQPRRYYRPDYRARTYYRHEYRPQYHRYQHERYYGYPRTRPPVRRHYESHHYYYDCR